MELKSPTDRCQGDARATHQKHPGGMFLRAPKRACGVFFWLAQSSFLGFTFRLRQTLSPPRRGVPFWSARKEPKSGSREASLPAVGNVALKALWASIASASLRDRPALENPAPAHRRRALRFGPRDRRLHWRRTAAPSKGGLHESQPAYPGRSIAAGVRCGKVLRLRLPCGALAAPAARWPV